jgi:hypothetical protein
MKTKVTYAESLRVIASLSMMLLLTNCKKDHSASESSALPTPAAASLATASVALLNVQTLYGAPYATGALVDGIGTVARFNQPLGLQLMPDETIYVADSRNNAIRKISAAGTVTTVNLKPSSSGAILAKPVYLGVEFATGTFHIVQDGNADADAYDQSWIFKNNGDFVATAYSYYVNATAISRDPYTDIFYYSSGSGITQHIAQPSGEIYGASINYDPEKLLFPENERGRGFSWDAIAIGYNKVVYFTKNGRIYKYTPGGVTERIFKDLTFNRITSMILNKDSRTMYLADNGYIKRVDGNKLTILAGPQGTNNGQDGTAAIADVHAFGLALAKGENALYFTDLPANTVRKLYLK